MIKYLALFLSLCFGYYSGISQNLESGTKENGLIALEYPEYLRFHKVKRYREIRLWKSRKRSYIPSGDYEARTIKVGRRKGYVIENKKFDVQGNLIEDYHYLAEGPLIYKYEYRYLKKNRDSYRIDSIFDKTGSYEIGVHHFIYRQDGQKLDSVEMYTLYDDNTRSTSSTISIEEYQKDNSAQEELVYLGEQLKIRKGPSYCCEYFYENQLLKKEIQYHENCQKTAQETIYKYDATGLLIGKKVVFSKSKAFTEYVYLYDYYPSDSN
ncbi:MAG: hypothetical protein JKY03_02160 [Aureispira sp.]|nr:hypothetical protein [Aureispira sp.]